ncbi:MAG: NAD(P)/FAD-dependent oxidoreductase [Clostridia bacterium]|nr:NAD(P)/FAD-dependent oxidoreductase [Clostridia bacterium]
MQIAVIGAGAAGLMAAGRAAELGGDVTLFEKNKFSGKKLRITGKGRCNVCNDCDVQTVIENVPTNPRFLYAALNSFTPSDTKDFFEGLGVPLKTERGNRVFPVSDKASDVVDALRAYTKRSGVKYVEEEVKGITVSENGFAVTARVVREFDRVIIATGGASYPLTGSTGDGYRFAKAFGIEVTDLSPSLVPLEIIEKDCAEMQGLSLKNTALEVIDSSNGKSVYRDFGEMMFTHYGVTGPMILSASSHLGKFERGGYQLKLDLKPALDEKTLDARLLSDFSKALNKDFANSLSALLPQKMIPVIVRRSGIDAAKKVNAITKEERKALLELLKGYTLTVKSFRPLSEAIITSGGVSVKEISPKTMEAKNVPGLFFCGEVIDVDAYTGGFNLQIAFSTARLAAENAIY